MSWRFSCLALVLLLAPAPLSLAADLPAKPLTAEQKEKLKEAARLRREAARLFGEKKNAEGLATWQKKVALEKEVLGNGHDTVLSSLQALARIHEQFQDFPAARKVRRQVLTALEGRRGGGHWRVTDARRDLRQVDVLAALTPEQRARLRRASALRGQAARFLREGKAAAALAPAREALRLRKEVLGEKHPQYANSLAYLAGVYHDLGEYEQALPLYRRARDIAREVLGEGHPHHAVSLSNLALLYQDTGDYARALPLFARARDITKEALGEAHPLYATALVNLAGLYQDLGEYARAKALYRRARDTAEPLGEKHPLYVASLNNLATLHWATGEYARAVPLFEQARDIRKDALGENHPLYAQSLCNLASLYHSLGDHARAVPLFERARDIRKGALGEKHPDYATSLGNLAGLYQDMGEYGRALPLFEQARDILRETVGEKHPDYAKALHNLATLHWAARDHARALPLFQRARGITKGAWGEKHPHYATALNNLALLYQAMGEHGRALPLFEQARDINKAARGERHPDYATSLQNLGLLHYARGEAGEAEGRLRESLEVRTQLLSQTLGGLGERPRLRLLASTRHTLDTWLSIGPKALPPALRQYAAVLNWRGTSADPHAPLRVARRQPELRNLVAELTGVRGRLTALAFRTPVPGQREGWLKEVDALRAKKEELEGELARKSKPFGRALARREVSPEAVASALPEGTALVDYLVYWHASPPAEGKHQLRSEPRLLAFVVTKGQSVRRLDLGDTRPIADAVRRWRKAVEGDEPADPGPAAAQLREAVWEPIEKHVKGLKTVLIAPDGALCSFPFAALPGKKKGTYLVEEYALGYLSSGRQLLDVADPIDDREAEGLLAVGEVAYGKGIFEPLPGTGPEANSCLDLFRAAYPKAESALLTRGDASEVNVKEALKKGPRYVHLATHGFFESPARLAARRKGALRDEPLALRDAEEQTFGLASLLKCGLAFAGASEPPLGGSADDGILTAEEVKGLDLGGCQLVTLSACQTALGQVEGMEGVMGLQRAFHAAGARSVVASLWHVDDAATSLLMRRFYRNLWDKKLPRLEALRQAQLSILRDPEGMKKEAVALRTEWTKRGIKGIKALPGGGKVEASSGRSHPALWAAFVLSGDWR